VWQIPDAVDTVVCAPDDGWKYHPKRVEQFPDMNKLCDVASCWIYIGILLAHPILHISRIRVKQIRKTASEASLCWSNLQPCHWTWCNVNLCFHLRCLAFIDTSTPLIYFTKWTFNNGHTRRSVSELGFGRVTLCNLCLTQGVFPVALGIELEMLASFKIIFLPCGFSSCHSFCINEVCSKCYYLSIVSICVFSKVR
jgi:hypothetical protein